MRGDEELIIDRLNVRMLIEAVRMLEEGFIKEDIDAMMRFRLGAPRGILELADAMGLRKVRDICKEVNIALPKTLVEMINKGEVGLEVGRDFYEYLKPGARVVPRIIPTDDMYKVNPLRLVAVAANEAAQLVRSGLCRRDDVDEIVVRAMGYQCGFLVMADRVGIDNIVAMLKYRLRETGLSEYEPDPLLKDVVKKGRLGMKTGEGFYKWEYERLDFGPVRYERRHDHALITMRRPEKLNALNEDMWEGLRKAFERAGDEPGVRVVLITGEGRAFSAGDDIAMMSTWTSAISAKDGPTDMLAPYLTS